MSYETQIQFALSGSLMSDADPALVLCVMRLDNGGTLDHLSRREFNTGARDAAVFVLNNDEMARNIARTY